jgi:hypothetical protein
MGTMRGRSDRGLFGSGRLLAIAAVVAVSGMTTTACEAAHEEDHPARTAGGQGSPGPQPGAVPTALIRPRTAS